MRNKVFISYSHRDDKWLARLQIFLKSIDQPEDVWADTRLEIGDDWLKEIRTALESARVAILLVSQDFLASRFITEQELPPLLEAASNAGTVIVPVIISPCILPQSLSQFQFANAPERPMVDLKRGDRDRVWVKVANRVKEVMAPPAPVVANRETAREKIRFEVQRRIDSFVDRKKEISSFCQMLETHERPVFYVWGGSGIGKTALFYRMVHECQVREYPKSILMWTDIRRYEYLDIMCKIKDDLGGDAFAPFTHELNSVSSLKPVVSNSGVTLGGNGGVAAGGNGSSHPASGATQASQGASISDLAAIERTRMVKLTDLFLGGLARALKNSRLIVLCDAVEKMSPSACDWFHQEFLQAVADGRLKNICFALCGRERPLFPGETRKIIEAAELQPLATDDIAEYLEKRSQAENLGNRVDQAMCAALAKRILRDTNGKPDDVTNWVETLINDYKNQPEA